MPFLAVSTREVQKTSAPATSRPHNDSLPATSAFENLADARGRTMYWFPLWNNVTYD